MPKPPAFAHQAESVSEFGLTGAHGLLWEQGTGKSRAVIDHALALRDAGEIDAIMVIAPNGVHFNWADQELPRHFDQPYHGHAWSSARAATKAHQNELHKLMNCGSRPMPVFTISYDSFMTPRGNKFSEQFVKGRRVLGILDESQRIKSRDAKRSIRALAWTKRFSHRRILSGTPVTKDPFDIWQQLKFLKTGFWKEYGFASFTSFRNYFGIIEQRTDPITNRLYPKVVDYRDLDKLQKIVSSICSRVLKEDVLDLPPKLYTKYSFDMSKEQWKVYNELRDDFLTWLDSGEYVAVPLMLTRMLRLQQVACGYLSNKHGEIVQQFSPNPRMKLLKETLEDTNTKALIFSRFRPEIDTICDMLGSEAIRYDGAVGEEDRRRGVKAFQDPAGPQFFVGNPAAAATGLTLHAAKTVIYASNSFNLEHRLQSEDRAHRIGQEDPVLYIDFAARGTIDGYILKSNRNKFNIASQVTGDRIREWI